MPQETRTHEASSANNSVARSDQSSRRSIVPHKSSCRRHQYPAMWRLQSEETLSAESQSSPDVIDRAYQNVVGPALTSARAESQSIRITDSPSITDRSRQGTAAKVPASVRLRRHVGHVGLKEECGESGVQFFRARPPLRVVAFLHRYPFSQQLSKLPAIQCDSTIV